MKERVIAIITEILQVPEGTVTENTLASELEEWDSLAQVMLIGELEKELGLQIDLEQAMEIQGVADILKLL